MRNCVHWRCTFQFPGSHRPTNARMICWRLYHPDTEIIISSLPGTKCMFCRRAPGPLPPQDAQQDGERASSYFTGSRPRSYRPPVIAVLIAYSVGQERPYVSDERMCLYNIGAKYSAGIRFICKKLICLYNRIVCTGE